MNFESEVNDNVTPFSMSVVLIFLLGASFLFGYQWFQFNTKARLDLWFGVFSLWHSWGRGQ
jgi:hypothetical protein